MSKKTLALILIALMAAFLSACDSDSSVSSMSLEPLSSMESSSSDSSLSASSAEERRSSIIQSSSSSSSSSGQVYYYVEMGEVCDGWTNRGVTDKQYYDVYQAMKSSCGDNVISLTPDSYGGIVLDWLDILHQADSNVVTLDVVCEVNAGFINYKQYFYVFDDAHKYIYVEPRMDGKGMY